MFAVISCLADEGEPGSPQRGAFYREFFESAVDPVLMMNAIKIDEMSNSKTRNSLQLCSVIASERLIVSMHHGGFVGLAECMQKMMHLKYPSEQALTTVNDDDNNHNHNDNSKEVVQGSNVSRALTHKFHPSFTSTVMSTLIAFTS